MRVVVLGHNGVGSRSHYITGYHGPRVSGWNTVYLYSPWGLYLMVWGVI